MIALKRNNPFSNDTELSKHRFTFVIFSKVDSTWRVFF